MSNNKKIYILHGWAYSTEKWGLFIAELKKYGFVPVLLQIPGLTAPLEEVWTLDDYVHWLELQLEKEKKVILLGHSNGGRISLAYTRKYPEKVQYLILIDSAGIYHNELPLKIKRIAFGSLAKIGGIFKKIPVIRKLFYKVVREHDYEKADPVLRQTMRNLIKADLTPVLSDIIVPVTIIWGANDKITPAGDAEIMHREIKNSKLFIIEGAKHSPMFTDVGKVVEIIKDKVK